MLRLLFSLLLCLFLGQLLSPQRALGAETTLGPSSGQAQASAQCDASTVEKNREIRRSCDANWNKWGVIPPPPQEELRSIHECASEEQTRNALLRNCPEGLLALPLMVGDLMAYGVASLVVATTTDKESPQYILAHGDEQALLSHFTNEYIRKECDGLATERDYQNLYQQICFNHLSQPKNEAGCAEYHRRVDAAIACRRNPELRRKYRDHVGEIESTTRQILVERAQKQREQQQAERSLEELKSTCGTILNPYRNTIAGYLLPGLVAGVDLKNATFPDAATVEKYNQCVRQKTRDNPQLQNELLKSSGSIIDRILGDFEAIDCYNQETRIKLKCEIIGGVVTGGAGIGAFAAKRLGRKALERAGQQIAERETRDIAEAHTDEVLAAALAANGGQSREAVEQAISVIIPTSKMGSCKVTCDTAVKKVFTQTRNDANPVRLDMYNVGSLHYHIRTDAGEIIDPTYQQFFNFGPDHPGEVFFGTGDELVAEIERLRTTVGFRERFSGFEKKSSQEIYDFLWGNGKLYRSGDDLNYYEDIGETLFD